jgi:hypothetical protein
MNQTTAKWSDFAPTELDRLVAFLADDVEFATHARDRYAADRQRVALDCLHVAALELNRRRGHVLYPAARLAGMSDTDLDQVMRFALADRAETSTTVYAGMDRADTVATARRTVDDVQRVMNRRAADRFAGVSLVAPWSDGVDHEPPATDA